MEYTGNGNAILMNELQKVLIMHLPILYKMFRDWQHPQQGNNNKHGHF